MHGAPILAYVAQPLKHLSPRSAFVGGALAIAGGRGKIMLFGVVLNGPAGRKFRSQARHALANPRQPFGRRPFSPRS